jgi:uncharacterized SAM-binding protein YcdF (DUF218 family)
MAASARRRRQIMPPVHSIKTLVAGLVFLVSIIVVFLVLGRLAGRNVQSTSTATVFEDPGDIPANVLLQLDAILILGGGRPISLDEPPVYVERRCDDAAAVAFRRRSLVRKGQSDERFGPAENTLLPILCLSAGTAHLPQLLEANSGLPIWEATSSAAYLSTRYNMSHNVFVETTSYDTIGNAFFARTSHSDIVGWRRLLIVTNEVSQYSSDSNLIHSQGSVVC